MTQPSVGHLLTPVDQEANRRGQRLRELGLYETPEPEFDAFARDLAQATDTAFAMVNFVNENRQFFAGLYVAPHTQVNAALATDTGAPEVTRMMEHDHGWCPHVVVRRLPLVLDDVCDYPRFAGNPVVDKVGIRTYLGAPLIDQSTGMALGTICVIDREPRPWGRPGLEFIKAKAAEMMDRLHQREGLIT